MGERFPRWLLHATVLFTVATPVRWMMRESAYIPKACLTCSKYGDAGFCALWEEEYQPDYLCNAWSVRELR